ncbi:MAG: RluA family pseudouridine synthase [Clostridiales bacterium]|nr:RluA family pseudouridine synthase [Clostridiales bacterium]
MIEIKIGSNEKEQRVDRFLMKLMVNDSRNNIFKYLRKKTISVNGKKVNENYFLQENDVIKIFLPEDVFNKLTEVKKSEIIDKYHLEIVFENEDILIVNKPIGLLTHPDQNEFKKTLSSYVNVYLSDYASRTFKPASIQRLDKNTSGLIIFAKNYDTLKKMNELMRERKIRKYYKTVVEGSMVGKREVKGYIVKDERTNRSIIFDKPVEGSKSVHTIFNVLQSNAQYTLLEVELLTGRSHQIRASLEAIGHPIVGDGKYGGKSVKGVERYLLHAYKVEFNGQEYSKDSEEIQEFIKKEF